MKRKLLYIALLLTASFSAKSQVFFNQNFNSPATIGTITGTGANQFNSTGTGTGSIAIDGDKLVMSRTAGTTYFVRNTDLAPATQFIKVQFKFSTTNAQTSTSPAIVFSFGSGFSNNGDIEPNENVWASLGILMHNNANYKLRDVTTPAVNAEGFYPKSTEATITLYMNATDEPQNYTGPDGESYTIPGQRWNAFVGTTDNVQTFASGTADRIPTTSSVAIKNFKFRLPQNTNNFVIDDLTMESLTVVLPVSLTSFTGKWENGAAQLKWQTASEQNNSHFEILRSADGINFNKIGTKDGEGTTAQISNYTYTDYAATAGDNYYKLRQVDFDGESKEYDAVVVKNPLQAQSLTAKITAIGNLEVSVNAASAKLATLTVTNVQGKKVAVRKVNLQQGNNVLPVPFSHVAAGVYIINVDGGKAQKFIKK